MKGLQLLHVDIETDRLKLLPLSEIHSEEIFREFDDEITKYMYPKPPDKMEDTLAFVESALKDMQNGISLHTEIIKKSTDEFLGLCGLHSIRSRHPELGIWLKKSAHGNGFGLEAIEGLIGWARTYLNYKALIYPVDKRNIPSRRIPERLNGVVRRMYPELSQSNRKLYILEYWIVG